MATNYLCRFTWSKCFWKRRCSLYSVSLPPSSPQSPAISLCSWHYRLRGYWNSREGGRTQPLKEWHSPWGYDKKNWLEPTRSKIVDGLISTESWTSLHAHRNTLAEWLSHGRHDCSEASRKAACRQWPNFWKLWPFPEIVDVILPTHLPKKLPSPIKTHHPICWGRCYVESFSQGRFLTFWDAHNLSFNKSTYLSLNFFCVET